MKKKVPAVFFQHRLTGSSAPVKRPAALELFEEQLHQVFGGERNTTTHCGSEGWLDVEQPDDTSI